MWSRTGRNGREKFRIQSEHSDFWYEPRPCPEHGLDKCFVMISGGPDDASDSPGGHLRGILTPAEERALDFFVRGVKFPWKFPESCFHPRGQISKGISRNLGQGQLRTQSGSPSNPHKTGMNGKSGVLLDATRHTELRGAAAGCRPGGCRRGRRRRHDDRHGSSSSRRPGIEVRADAEISGEDTENDDDDPADMSSSEKDELADPDAEPERRIGSGSDRATCWRTK